MKNTRLTFIPSGNRLESPIYPGRREIDHFIDVDAADQSRPAGRFYRMNPCPSAYSNRSMKGATLELSLAWDAAMA